MSFSIYKENRNKLFLQQFKTLLDADKSYYIDLLVKNDFKSEKIY